MAESLGNIDVACDGCSPGIVKMYQDYIDGKMELKDVNMAFQARYVSGEDGPEKEFSCDILSKSTAGNNSYR